MHKESRLRSMLKGFSWRIIATGTIICITFLTTGDVALAFEIGAIEFFVKSLLYYIHERAWAQIPRGVFRNFYIKYLKFR